MSYLVTVIDRATNDVECHGPYEAIAGCQPDWMYALTQMHVQAQLLVRLGHPGSVMLSKQVGMNLVDFAYFQVRIPRYCRVCGCTEEHACFDPFGDPCHWVAQDLCSECESAGAPLAAPDSSAAEILEAFQC